MQIFTSMQYSLIGFFFLWWSGFESWTCIYYVVINLALT